VLSERTRQGLFLKNFQHDDTNPSNHGDNPRKSPNTIRDFAIEEHVRHYRENKATKRGYDSDSEHNHRIKKKN
jgi:hypothetical protein